MSEVNEPASPARRNPLIWFALIVIGLILFVFLGGDRQDPMPRVEVDGVSEVDDFNDVDDVSIGETEQAGGTIERSLLLPPGMRAREYIAQLRASGKPYPLSKAFEKAQKFQQEGSLADAHLLYFFAAREGHLPAIMMMGEMSDPLLFRAENSLLDRADVVQAYKWYRKARELGQANAAERIEALREWATDAAAAGQFEAEQFLLNIQ